MLDSSHGSAYLPRLRVNAQSRDHRVSQTHADLRVVDRQHRRREWITRAGSCAARVPVWRSRRAWLHDVQVWAATPLLAQVCRSERVSIAAPTLVAIATAMAGHADHATGRHCAATRATIAAAAGCGPDTVTVAWRVLRTAGWALEAQRGHGSPTTPGCGRRPSIYHLIPARPQPTCAPVAVEFPDLPRSGAVSSLRPVGTPSPSAQTRARTENPRPKNRGPRRGPRPLPLQRLAAELINACHGLSHGHAGAICDAINSAGIDPQVWTARQITAALNADMAARGWMWPDRVERPGAFLASRLRRLDWRPCGPPTNSDGGYAAGTDKSTPSATTTAVRCAPPIPATDAHRAEAMAAIRATLTRPRSMPSAHIHLPAGHRSKSVNQPGGHDHPSTAGGAQPLDPAARPARRTNPPVGHPV
ncbi:rep protein [Mycobacterium avium subsp. hominissuis]